MLAAGTIDLNGITLAMIASGTTIIVAFLGYLGVKLASANKKIDNQNAVLDTGNGRDLGVTVYDIARVQGEMVNQLSANSRQMGDMKIQFAKHTVDLSERKLVMDPFIEEVRAFMENHTHGTG